MALVAAFLASGASSARAADEALGASLAVDVPVTAGAAALWLTGEFARGSLAPTACRWCAPAPAEDELARAAVWRRPALAATLSDVGVYAVLPLLVGAGVVAGAALERRLDHRVLWDLLLIAEAVAVAQAVNQLTKFLVARERPFVHWLDPADKPFTAQPSDNNLSFYSGHTTFAFALVMSGWAVARLRSAPWADAFLYAGLPLASAVAYLRMAAGKHYLSDVLVGAALGAAIGIFVPALHQFRRFLAPRGVDAAVTLAPVEGGALAALAWRF